MRLLDLPAFSLLVFALVLTAPLGARALTFDDGEVHVIDATNSFPLERIEVFDGIGLGTAAPARRYSPDA